MKIIQIWILVLLETAGRVAGPRTSCLHSIGRCLTLALCVLLTACGKGGGADSQAAGITPINQSPSNNSPAPPYDPAANQWIGTYHNGDINNPALIIVTATTINFGNGDLPRQAGANNFGTCLGQYSCATINYWSDPQTLSSISLAEAIDTTNVVLVNEYWGMVGYGGYHQFSGITCYVTE